MSYISTLNLLNADSPTQMNEEAFQEELALWANAQFSFDTTPGSAIVEDKKENSNLLETFKEIAQLVQHDNSSNNNNLNYYNIAPAPSTPGMPPILPRLAPSLTVGVKPSENSISPFSQKKKSESKDGNEPISAEEDKRRRNTAASARFRMKKKQREQELEKKAKELADYVEKLESKVNDLEKEAKWLRALVIEKDPKLLPSKDQ